jgi:WD40 repeat protein
MLADIQLDPLTAAALALPSGHLAIGNEAGDLRLCSLVDGEAAIECEVLNGDFGSIHKLAFSSDGAMVAVGDTGGSIAVFSLDGDQEPRRLSINAPVESLTALTFSRDDRFLIAGVAANVGEPADAENGAGAILLWELETERETRQDRRAPVTALAAGPGTLDVTSYDTEAMIWTIGDGTLTNPRPLPFRPPAPPQALATPSALPASGQVQGLAFDAKANRLAVAGDGGGLVWDMTTNALVFENRAQMLGTQAIAFSPDGSDVATGTGFGAIYVWDIAEGAVAVPLGTLPAAVLDLAWDEQGRLLVVDANGALTALELDAIDWIAEACQTVAEFTPQELPAASDGSSEQTCQDVLSVTGASPVPIG